MELIRFFCEVKIHDHAHYFVDSLWEYCEVLHDWEAMSQLLLDDKSSFTLKDDEVAALIEIMTCAVRRAAGATPPVGRSRGKVNEFMCCCVPHLMNVFWFGMNYLALQ